ncbi:MAG: acetyl-CoA hydrolase/transferase C-terminal domain-containing protein [Pseudomonadales bacterium]
MFTQLQWPLYWQPSKQAKGMRVQSIEAILGQLTANESIFIAGSSAEPRPVVETLYRLSAQLPPLEIVHSFVPGINNTPLAAAHNEITEISIFPRKGYGSLDKKVGLIPCSYYGYDLFLSQRRFDWCIVQVSPPDAKGRYCLGPSVEFLPQVLRNSRLIIGVINPQVPNIDGSAFIDGSLLTHACEIDSPLVSYDAGDVDTVSAKISANVATLVDDGSTLQLGLGKIPAQLLEKLTDRSDLCFHTGLLTAGYFNLLEAGALKVDKDHHTCASLGDAAFYHRLGDTLRLKVCGVEYTHAPATLAELGSLVAINSAIEVDLFGQANLEFVGNRQVSSSGGAPDFARAARTAPYGKSIIALPATAAKGAVSRIVPRLPTHQPISLARHDIDYVVTEFGVAHISGQPVASRAHALISVAAPEFRESLEKSLDTYR